MTVTIYHNPACSTSRNVLAMIRESGIEPVVIEYLKTPPSRETLEKFIAVIPVRALVREKEAAALHVDPQSTDEQLVDALLQHPVLMQRPIVVSPLGTRLCRPAESVREILPV